MHNKYSIWQYVAIFAICVIGILYSIPNIYLDEPAIQISVNGYNQSISEKTTAKIKANFKKNNIETKSFVFENDDAYIRFHDTDTQLKAIDVVKQNLDENVTAALTLLPTTPKWLQMIHADPMKLGLDLRGGVHLLLEVDINSIIKRKEEALVRTVKKELRKARIRYDGVSSNSAQHSIKVKFKDLALRDQAYKIIKKEMSDVELKTSLVNGSYNLDATYSSQSLNEMRQNTIEQTMSTLRGRVNELGVAEAIVQQQGSNRVSVDLPGIQDAARAKSILGGTATLEFHLQDIENSAQDAAQSGIIPAGSKLYDYEGRPYLIKREVILSGDSITSAMSSFDEMGQPSVNISLGGGGESKFNRVTRDNIGRAMPILFIETKMTHKVVDGKEVKKRKKIEKIISAAVIQSALPGNFRITGLPDPNEARDLALLLRAGALPAPVDIVEESTVGPSLGMENIQRGLVSLAVGMIIVIILMMLYYRVLGFIADIALILNLFLLVSLLSWIGATLTLPGIAAIVLTLGMAIDANVLIYERIREELRNGITVQAAIYSGYDRAFVTIVDANLTTLIVAVVLLAMGSGPIQAFAVTLILGLITSMFTGLACTRAIINLVYGERKLDKLSIGI